MTRELKEFLGQSVYDTLVRGLQWPHGSWLERVSQKYHATPPTYITQEGVDEMRDWTLEDFDDLSGIGPAKAKRIRNALDELGRRSAGTDSTP